MDPQDNDEPNNHIGDDGFSSQISFKKRFLYRYSIENPTGPDLAPREFQGHAQARSNSLSAENAQNLLAPNEPVQNVPIIKEEVEEEEIALPIHQLDSVLKEEEEHAESKAENIHAIEPARSKKPSIAEIFSAFQNIWNQRPKPLKGKTSKPARSVKNGKENILKSASKKSAKANPKKHECEFCGKRYELHEQFQAHRRRHLAKTSGRYRCDVCEKTFVQHSSLKTHQRIHTGEKPHVCPTCGCGYGDLSTYTKHCRTHTKEKPYTCVYCGMTFSQSGNRHRHTRKVHKELLEADNQ